MNPNDALAAVNVTIAIAMFFLATLFFCTLYFNPPQTHLRRVFIVVMGIGYTLLMLDYGTTGILRIVDIVAFPGVPHSLLPDFAIFPVGISLLLVWRILLSLTLWGLILYITVFRRGEDS